MSHLTKFDVILLGGIITGFALIWIAHEHYYLLPFQLMIGGMLLFIAMLTIVIHRHYVEITSHLRTELATATASSVQSLFYLAPYLQRPMPLSPIGGWAASADFLAQLVATIKAMKPSLIVEIGSGTSTVLAAMCLEEIGEGRIISLEHDGAFADMTNRHLKIHGLTHRSHVIYAPIESVDLQGKQWKWYKTADLDLPGPIDLLVVDGPPGGTQSLARYPALPILHKSLNNTATILLDDGNRADEKTIVEMWASLYPDLDCFYVPTHAGMFVIKRNKRHSN